MEKVIPNWTNHHKEQGFGSKIKKLKTKASIEGGSQTFSQEDSWQDLLIRSAWAASLGRGPGFPRAQEQPKAGCALAALLLSPPTLRKQLTAPPEAGILIS